MYNQILCGNHLDVLPKFADGTFDMFLTSPPYDNLRSYEGYDFQFEPLARELYRVLKPGGVGVWIVNDTTVDGSETLTSFKQALYFKEEVGFNVHDTMIYAKNYVTFPDKFRYYQSFEYMFVLAKGKPATKNLLCDKKNKHHSERIAGTQRKPNGALIPKKRGIIKSLGVRQNIWGYNSASNESGGEHPARFPEKLAEDHILSWSNPGDVVLDPMCGSGTACKMAAKHGRRYVGIDIAEKYCEIARKRVAVIESQPMLFDANN